VVQQAQQQSGHSHVVPMPIPMHELDRARGVACPDHVAVDTVLALAKDPFSSLTS
jgi:hypothetical protein